MDSDSDFDMDDSPLVVRKKAPSQVKSGGLTKTKSASERYQKKTPLEHVLLRPDSYVGSVEQKSESMWVHDPEAGMVKREVTFVPGLYKIFDEILVNAADNKQRDPSMDVLRVDIDKENNSISVYNNGRVQGIPVEMHEVENMWIPTMIFGHLLTSSNYDDSEKKVTGGRNGYGAKLANIFSTKFVLETADPTQKKKFKQIWTNNMQKAGKETITSNSKGDSYTRVTFYPDLQRFGMEDLDNDIIGLMSRRVYDVAGCIPDVKIYLNGKRLPIKNFGHYVKLYMKEDQKCEYIEVGDRWKVGIASTDGDPDQVSFVNSIATSRGGTHVKYITDMIVGAVIDQVKKKAKKTTVKPGTVKPFLFVFVNALIENPTFDSQTKETLTLPKSKFGSTCKLPDTFMKKVLKLDIVEKVLERGMAAADAALRKTSGKKKARVTGIKKLDDANNAGTRRAKNCTLILTEGDSAKALAISGLSVVGRDDYGVFPLRGKLLNVRDATAMQVKNNEEINAIKQILGLVHGKTYSTEKDLQTLRYGHLMIMTDQDHDGSHIKGLLINFIHTFWPSLLKFPGFIQEFVTPIVKVRKGQKSLSFYTMPEYESWKESDGSSGKWKVRYYKGLGTSTSQEAKEYFRAINRHQIEFAHEGPVADQKIEMAFSKKQADARKTWLLECEDGTFIDHEKSSLGYAEFIDKELVLYSLADCERSIPSVVDGFKPGQRKILYSCFKRNLKDDIKVAQLAGYVSEHSAYHHGEASLMATVIGMAQTFVGSNNINLLFPNGQFGTRLQGGKDAASPRYIFTRLSEITRTIFCQSDDAILTYNDDDGQSVEPKWYMPIIPMVLVNGAEGIGTGWSTTVPCYNPRDIIDNLRRLLAGEQPHRMHPWYRGFNGTIEADDSKSNYLVRGTYELDEEENNVIVTELPIRSWTQPYKEFVEEMLVDSASKKDHIISDMRDNSTEEAVRITLSFTDENYVALQKGDLEKKLKLTSKQFSTSNMHLFSPDGRIKKYASVDEILREFYHLRLEYYQKRKDYLRSIMEEQVKRISNKARFILMVINDEIVISKRAKADLMAELEELKFDKMGKTSRNVRAKNAVVSKEDAENESASYDYLLSMPLWNLTKEKVEALLNEKEEKEVALNELIGTSTTQMWRTDLDNLEEAIEAFFEQDAQNRKAEPGRANARRKPAKKKAAPKKPVKKEVKKESMDLEDDWEEDPKPVKKKPVPKKTIKREPVSKMDDSEDDWEAESPKPAKKKAAPKKAVKKEPAVPAKRKPDSSPEGEPKPKRAASKKTLSKAATLTWDDDSDDDSDLDMLLSSRSSSTKKKAPSAMLRKKSSQTVPLSDDEDDEEKPQPKAAAKRKAVVKKPAPKRKTAPKKQAVISSDEDEMELEVAKPMKKAVVKKAPVKKAPAKKKAPVKKKASAVISSDEDDEFEMEVEAKKPPKRATSSRAAAKKSKSISDLISSDSDDAFIDDEDDDGWNEEEDSDFEV